MTREEEIQKLIESLWHDISEEPQNRQLIVIDHNGAELFIWRHAQEGIWERLTITCKLKRWAYINDLLPKGDEK